MSIYLFIKTYVICMCCRVCIINTHPTILIFAQCREEKMYVTLPVNNLVLKKTLPKNPTTLLTDISNVSERQSTTTLTSTMTLTPTATANQPPKSSSPISEFLELPLPPRCSKKGKKPDPARVLTSQQSLEMLMEKGRKKKEEEAEKERKKREREEKRKLRVEMNMRKAEKRKVRIEERKRKAEEKAQELVWRSRPFTKR